MLAPASAPAPAPSGADGPFLDVPGAPPVDKTRAWRWLFYAVVGFVVGQVAAAVLAFAAGGIAGKTAAQMSRIASESVPPEWYVVTTLVGLWVGFFGAPWLASRTQGTRRLLADVGLRFRPSDAFGIFIGVGGQLIIALMYAPFRHDIKNFNAPSQHLTGSAHGWGYAVIAVFTVVGAPFMEELFFRGLLFRALVRLFTPVTLSPASSRRAGVVVAVIVDGILFGLAHAEWVQLAGLALFGMALATVSYRTGRLGMNMVAHASFNLVAVLAILGQRGVVLH